MGLDVSHDCWHGAYSAFMRWRTKLAEVAGLPPLNLMEGFYTEAEPGSFVACFSQRDRESGDFMYPGLPIRWDCLKPDPLHALLHHSDCDGEIAAEVCLVIAERLMQLLPLLPDEEAPGHIGNWRAKTQAFIDGLRAAHAAGEPVNFH